VARIAELWRYEDEAFIPDCEIGKGCPLADANFPEDASPELIDATKAGCRCQDEAFLALFERSEWFQFASTYIQERDAGVAASPDTLSPLERFAITTLHHLLKQAEGEYQEERLKENPDAANG
jgi:hypothetical protein